MYLKFEAFNGKSTSMLRFCRLGFLSVLELSENSFQFDRESAGGPPRGFSLNFLYRQSKRTQETAKRDAVFLRRRNICTEIA